MQVPIAQAAGIVVNALGDTTGPCAASGTGTCSLRDAITYANGTADADTITFGVSGTITLDSSLPAIKHSLTIDGTGATIIVDANSGSNILTVTRAGTLTLTGVTLANGKCGSYQTDFGAGILNRGTLTVNSATFSGNNGCKGGGGIANYRTATVTGSLFTGNEALFGGGIANENGTLTVIKSTFDGNTAGPPFGVITSGYGGGIWNDNDAALQVTKSTFSNNTAETDGGGIANIGRATVTGGAFSGNSADNGGGLANGIDISAHGTFTVKNGTFSKNSASDYGAGMSNQGGTLSVSGSTLTENETDLSGYGGGIAILTGTLNLTTSAVSTNYAKRGGGIYNDSGTLNLTAGTLAENNGWGSGGGIYNTGGAVIVTNSTVAKNTTHYEYGGGIYTEDGTLYLVNTTMALNTCACAALDFGAAGIYGNGTAITLSNTILANNDNTNVMYNCDVDANKISAKGKNFADDKTCPGIFAVATSSLNLGDLKDNGGPTQTIKPGPGSYARDVGDNRICAAGVGAPSYGAGGLDQRGVLRPQGPGCDVGSYEVRGN